MCKLSHMFCMYMQIAFDCMGHNIYICLTIQTGCKYSTVYFTVLPRGYLPIYIYGFSLAWTLLCFVNSLLDIQPFPHTLQGYGLSPVWNLIWILNVLPSLKSFPHVSHEYGFSPVWPRMCFVNSLLDIQPFPHTSQGYGLSPVWNLI